ncbi:hypothetical protein [Sphingobium sp.]|uniref:hypothetical protein n=1 Tax=Sphingobium sp. TaxID=1912891 RepID=UPI003B3A2D7F
MRLPIPVALLTLIAVTLLSALAPLGPPLSRVTGSAFNPATAEVVLKGRAQAVSQLAQPARPDGGDGAPPMIVALALAIVLLTLHFVRPTCPLSAYRANIRAFAPVRTRRARAPPASF